MPEEEKDVKALFYIAPKEKHVRVQNIGCRMLIAEKLIHAGFKKGGAFNLPDGRVEVVLEGKQKDIELFYTDITKNLVEWLIERADNKETVKRMIGNPGIGYSKLEFTDAILVLDIGLYSHSLELGQLQKGVTFFRSERKKADTNCCSNSYMDAYINMTNAIKENTDASIELKKLIRERLSK